MENLRALISTLPFQERRIVRYVISGGTATAANLSLLFILTHWAGLWYLYSSIIAISAATIVSFTLQKLWTFRNFDIERIRMQFPMHATLALFNIGANTVLLYTLVEWVHIWYLLAQVISGALLACLNYYVYKTHIFHDTA